MKTTLRRNATLAAVACAALLTFGYYLQYAEGQDPCPLCLVQRGFYFGLLAVFTAAAVHAPWRSGRIGWGIAAFVFAGGGLATAARQVWLQHLPADQVPACGPDLFFMIENMAFLRTLEKLFAGSGQCAEVKWRFIGLSIAEWSLAWFAVFAALALWMTFSKEKGVRPLFR